MDNRRADAQPITDDSLQKQRELAAEIGGFHICDEKWQFYYDESGNLRKFRLNDDGSFNDPKAIKCYFVLGGLVFNNCDDVKTFDAQNLINSLNLQNNISELKSKHLCPTSWDFEHFIKCERVSKILNWVFNSNANIHFIIENNFYFAIVDIVESLIGIEQLGEFHFDLKDALYKIIFSNVDEFSTLLANFGYPDLEDTKGFWISLSDFINHHKDNCPYFSNDPNIEILRSMVRYTAKHPEKQNNAFLTNNKKGELQDSYSSLYDSRCRTYLFAQHFFDEEPQIKPIMQMSNLQNFSFIESKKEYLIQISDCLVAIVAKVFNFIESKNLFEIKDYSSKMDFQSKQNLQLFYKLILRSEEKHPALIQRIVPISKLNEHYTKLKMLTT